MLRENLFGLNISVGRASLIINFTTDPYLLKLKEMSISPNRSVNNNFNISIFPNPVSDLLTIETKTGRKLRAQVIDINGKVLLSKNINNRFTQFQLEQLVSGSYYLSLSDGLSISTVKFKKI